MSKTIVNGVALDCNLKLAVPEDLGVDFVFQCKHGFWWGQKKTPATFDLETAEAWTPEKVVLHVRAPELGVLRTALAEDWLTRVYEVTEIEIYKADITVNIAMINKS